MLLGVWVGLGFGLWFDNSDLDSEPWWCRLILALIVPLMPAMALYIGLTTKPKEQKPS
jgi:hypothetical protein